MHIPMEFLSPQTTRTDSGAGVRNAPRSQQDKQGSRFEKVFEDELSRHDQKMLKKNTNPVSDTNSTQPNAEKAETVTIQKKDEKIEDNGEALAAGVMGNQANEVVFILEGDKESVATPEMRVETVEPPDTTQIVNPENKENQTETTNTAEAAKSNEFTLNTNDEAQTSVKDQVAAAVQAETTGPAIKQENAKPDAAENEINAKTNAAGEVTARMPEIRTTDNQENAQQNNNDFSRYGNLSPLENENDKTEATGQEDKTYAAAASAVKNKTEDKNANTTSETTTSEIPPPLSDGIKPEQFKAAQQMTQAAANTPVKAENLFEEMIARVETIKNDTKSSMTIQLNPEFLGKVALEITSDAAGLHVKINAEDSGVRGMINGQLTALVESLENKGIAVAEVEVIYTGINFGTFKEPGAEEQGQQRSRGQNKHHEVNAKDAVAYYTTLPDLMDYYLDTGISSVEYRA